MIEATGNPSFKSRIMRSSISLHHPLMSSGSRPKNGMKQSYRMHFRMSIKVKQSEVVAVNYGIPNSTLHDKISGRVTTEGRSGLTPYLSLEEEDELVFFLNGCASIGYAHTKK